MEASRHVDILSKCLSFRNVLYCTSQGSAKCFLSQAHFSTKGTPFPLLYVAPPCCPTKTAGELPIPAASPQPCWGWRHGNGGRGSSCLGTESLARSKEGSGRKRFLCFANLVCSVLLAVQLWKGLEKERLL